MDYILHLADTKNCASNLFGLSWNNWYPNHLKTYYYDSYDVNLKLKLINLRHINLRGNGLKEKRWMMYSITNICVLIDVKGWSCKISTEVARMKTT